MINSVTFANTVSWGKLLVTVFAAPYLDRMPEALTLQSSNNLLHPKAIAKPGVRHFANTAPYPAAHRDNSMLATGTINRWIAPSNVTSLNCRAVSIYAAAYLQDNLLIT
jgi:hypothetical protein